MERGSGLTLRGPLVKLFSRGFRTQTDSHGQRFNEPAAHRVGSPASVSYAGSTVHSITHRGQTSNHCMTGSRTEVGGPAGERFATRGVGVTTAAQKARTFGADGATAAPRSDGATAAPRVMVVGAGWRFTSGISYYTCRLINAIAEVAPVLTFILGAHHGG